MSGMLDMVFGVLFIVFGDFCWGYLIIDCIGVCVLCDFYINKLNVYFYIIKCVGGGVVNFECFKVLEMV